MFWLVHIHDENSLLESNFGLAFSVGVRYIKLDHKEFAIGHWWGPSGKFIEKWKRAAAPCFSMWALTSSTLQVPKWLPA
jgi:hypothetical protein